MVERGETVVINHLKPKRNISALRIIAIGFNIFNSWLAIAASLSVAIAKGGTVSIIYGVLITFFLYTCAALTLVELAAIYPTAGGQYPLSSILAPKKANKFIPYSCGMIAMSSRVAINASVNIVGAQMITPGVQCFLDYVRQTWHVFLIYQALFRPSGPASSLHSSVVLACLTQSQTWSPFSMTCRFILGNNSVFISSLNV